MPFSGYLVYTGRFHLLWVGLAGAVGCNLGSLVAYYVGSVGGRPLVERYGRWLAGDSPRSRNGGSLLCAIR